MRDRKLVKVTSLGNIVRGAWLELKNKEIS